MLHVRTSRALSHLVTPLAHELANLTTPLTARELAVAPCHTVLPTMPRLVWTSPMDTALLGFLKECNGLPEYCGDNGFKSKAYTTVAEKMTTAGYTLTTRQVKTRWTNVSFLECVPKSYMTNKYYYCVSSSRPVLLS